MAEKNSLKETIIQVTTELIEENDGKVDRITARVIATRANIGLGLINYHFGSKEKLIAICVQRIIGEVISNFDTTKVYLTDKERLTAWAIHVFNFLFEHSAIAKISILSDLQNYTPKSNSAFTQYGFRNALTSTSDERDKAFLSFVLTAAMQVAFLGCEAVKDLLGYNFEDVNDREAYIKKLVSTMLANTERA